MLELMPHTASAAAALAAGLLALSQGRKVAVATVLDRQGSAPATPGQKLVLCERSLAEPARAVGTVGGGAIERAVLLAMSQALRTPSHRARVQTYRLGPSLGMCCGGSAEVLIEVMVPRAPVLIVGAGHVGSCTARLLAELDFAVVLVDARERVALAAEAVVGVTFVRADHDDPEVLAALGGPAALSSALVMTHDHQLDQRAIEWALRAGFGFVGGVGSRAKAERTAQRLLARGLLAAEVARVRMPLGTAIGARRPMEIAVAIAGEMVALRAQQEGLVRAHGQAPLEQQGSPLPALPMLESAVDAHKNSATR